MTQDDYESLARCFDKAGTALLEISKTMLVLAGEADEGDTSDPGDPPSESYDDAVTLEAVRELMNDVGATIGTGAVIQIVQSLGAKKLSELPEDKWVEAYKAAEEKLAKHK